jgi:hypothetical protein
VTTGCPRLPFVPKFGWPVPIFFDNRVYPGKKPKEKWLKGKSKKIVIILAQKALVVNQIKVLKLLDINIHAILFHIKTISAIINHRAVLL